MRPQWLALGWVCLLAGSVYSAAVPTQDTMVVARSDDGDSATSTSAPVTEVTTEEPVPPIKLTDMEVTSTIALRYAHTAVVTSVRNPAKRAQEATFRVLLPETAFISGFTMTLEGKSYKAYVKEKEEAKQIYNQAVSQGLGAAHVAVKARDSNQFTVSVNVEPNTVAIFNLTYEELLVRRNGVYNHAINLHPGALVPKLTVTVNVKETQKITTLRVPEVRTGNEIDATEEDAQNSKAVIEKSNNDREAKIVFKPNLEEQQRLIEIYREKTKETRTPSYSYGYDPNEDGNVKEADGVLGQFVVQYDVERAKNGEVLVNDGYFVHFFAPSELPPLNKHVVFVLDTSGSMTDRKIVQLREAMQTILGELNQGDYFNIVEFSSSVKVYEMKEADKEPMQHSNYGYHFPDYNSVPKLVPPTQATPDNVAKAKVIISRLYASGGTNIYGALNVAVDLIKKGVGWTPGPDVPTPVPKPTDEALPEAVAASAAATTEVAQKEETTAADATEVAKESIKLEPIIIFLTDGDPTVGETDPTRIINHLTEKNAGQNKATIFSLAFGEDADRKFLRKLSLRNDGFMRHIYEAADAALQLRDFYRQVASPLLADVKFIYPKKQVKEGSVTKQRFRRFYAGSETVVAGILEEGGAELTPQVEAFCGVEDSFRRKLFEISPKTPVVVQKEKFLPLERLWAHLTVKQLLDERDAADRADDDAPDAPGKKALAIALKYEFVTPLTSLVVVKPNATDHVDAESVDKQNHGFGGAAGFGAGAGGFGGAALFGPSAPAVPGQPLPVYATALSRPGFALPQYAFASQSVQDGASLMQVDALQEAFEYDDPSQHAGFSGMPSLIQGGQLAYNRGAISFPASKSAITTPQVFYEPASFDVVEPLIALSTTGPTTHPPATSSPATPDALAVYHLQEFPWLRPLLAENDTLTLQVNSTSVTLHLAKDTVPKPESGPDAECAAATDGAAGVCVYLTRCDAARALTAQAYSNAYCVVGDQYAGVCCPKGSVDVAKSR